MSDFDFLDQPPFPPRAPMQERPRILLAPLYAQHVDLRLHVCPGDLVMVNSKWSVVKDIKLWRNPRRRHANIPVRLGWDGLEVITTNGSRWFGYPQRSLPTVPVSRKRPLW